MQLGRLASPKIRSWQTGDSEKADGIAPLQKPADLKCRKYGF